MLAKCVAPTYRKIMTNKDAFDWGADMTEALLACKAKHDALRKSILKFNKKEPKE